MPLSYMEHFLLQTADIKPQLSAKDLTPATN